MGKTAFTGPIYGNADSNGGVFDGLPIELVNQANAQVFFEDFSVAEDFVGTKWTTTDVGTTTATPSIAQDFGRSLLAMNVDAAANEGHVVQLRNDIFKPAANRVIAFEALYGIVRPTFMDVFIGVSPTDTDFLGTNGTISGSAANYAGMHLLASEGTGIPSMVARGASGSASNVGALSPALSAVDVIAETGFFRFGLRIEGTSIVKFYHNRKLIGEVSVAVAFADSITPTIASLGGGSATDITFVDYVAMSQTR